MRNRATCYAFAGGNDLIVTFVSFMASNMVAFPVGDPYRAYQDALDFF